MIDNIIGDILSNNGGKEGPVREPGYKEFSAKFRLGVALDILKLLSQFDADASNGKPLVDKIIDRLAGNDTRQRILIESIISMGSVATALDAKAEVERARDLLCSMIEDSLDAQVDEAWAKEKAGK
jgi:hypothetical protein